MAYSLEVGDEIIKAARQAPYLERNEEKELALAWRERGDGKALHKITSAHMRLVIALAVRFHHRYRLSVSDLVQEGNVGLMEAAARFEPERDVRFSTYATWWIRSSIQDYILRNWSIVRSGRSSTQRALFFSLRRLRARIAFVPQSSASSDVYQSLALGIGVSRADVELMNSRLGGLDVSLNSPLVASDLSASAERMDYLVDDSPLPDQVVEDRLDFERKARWLGEALKRLSAREMRVVAERYLSESPVTLESLGARFGVSKERVRQIESCALNKLRQMLIRTQNEVKKDDGPESARRRPDIVWTAGGPQLYRTRRTRHPETVIY